MTKSVVLLCVIAVAVGIQLHNTAAKGEGNRFAPGYFCAREHTGKACVCTGTVSYGAKGKWSVKQVQGSTACNNKVFGDPKRGIVKNCYCVPVPVAGPKGKTGATGPIGATGPAGPAGTKGATGSPGPIGADGKIGLTGHKGEQGETGAVGAAGAKGETGATGPIGVTGPVGPAGADGAIGTPGKNGADGQNGVPGPAGPQGETGPQGPAGSPATSPATTCKAAHTKNEANKYHMVNVNPANGVVFTVQAKNDAHLGFFTSANNKQQMYEIVIGGWGNSQSVIRRSNQGTNLATKKTSAINDANAPKQFWASAINGLVQFGTGATIGADTVLSYQDPNPLAIANFGVMTGWGSEGTWNICA